MERKRIFRREKNWTLEKDGKTGERKPEATQNSDTIKSSITNVRRILSDLDINTLNKGEKDKLNEVIKQIQDESEKDIKTVDKGFHDRFSQFTTAMCITDTRRQVRVDASKRLIQNRSNIEKIETLLQGDQKVIHALLEEADTKAILDFLNMRSIEEIKLLSVTRQSLWSPQSVSPDTDLPTFFFTKKAALDDHNTEHRPPTDKPLTHEHVVKLEEGVDGKSPSTDKPPTQIGQIYCYATEYGWIQTMLEHNNQPDPKLFDKIDNVSNQARNLATEVKKFEDSLAGATPLLGQRPADLLQPHFLSLQAASQEFSQCFESCTPLIKDIFQNIPWDSIRSDVDRQTQEFLATADDDTKQDRAFFEHAIAIDTIKKHLDEKLTSYSTDQQNDIKNLFDSANRYIREIQNIQTKLDTLRDLYSLDHTWKNLTQVSERIKPSTNTLSELWDITRSCSEIADRGYDEIRGKVTACEEPLLRIREVCNNWLEELKSGVKANYERALNKAKTQLARRMIDHEQTILDFSHTSVKEVQAQRGILYAMAFQFSRAFSRVIDTRTIAVKPPHAESLNTQITSPSPDTMELSTQIGDTTYQSSLRRSDQTRAEMTFEKATSTNQSQEPERPDEAALTLSKVLRHHANLTLAQVSDAKLQITMKIDDPAAIVPRLPEFGNSTQQRTEAYRQDDLEFQSLLGYSPEGRALNALLNDHPEKQISKIEVTGNNTEIKIMCEFDANLEYFSKLGAEKDTSTIRADYAIMATKDLAEQYDHRKWHDRINREIGPADHRPWRDDNSNHSDDNLYVVIKVPDAESNTPRAELDDAQDHEQTRLQLLVENHTISARNTVNNRFQEALSNVVDHEMHPLLRDLRLFHLKKGLNAVEKIEFPRVSFDLPTNLEELKQLHEDLNRLGPDSFYKQLLPPQQDLNPQQDQEILPQQDLNPQQDQEIQHSPPDTSEESNLGLFPRARELQTNLANWYTQLLPGLTEAAFIVRNQEMSYTTRGFFSRHLWKLIDASEALDKNFSTALPDFPTNLEEWSQLQKDYADRNLRSNAWYKQALNDRQKRVEWLRNDPEKRFVQDPELQKEVLDALFGESHSDLIGIQNDHEEFLQDRRSSIEITDKEITDENRADLAFGSLANRRHLRWQVADNHANAITRSPSQQHLARQTALRDLWLLQSRQPGRRNSF